MCVISVSGMSMNGDVPILARMCGIELEHTPQLKYAEIHVPKLLHVGIINVQ